jgi:hypothetical protein
MTGTKQKDGKQVPPVRDFTRLKACEIEKAFNQTILDLDKILVLDGVDSRENGFQIRCHDPTGQLPEIIIQNSGDTLKDKDQIGRETCKLIAISGLRDDMRRWLRGGRFLPPTRMDSQAVVGFHVGSKTWIVDGNDFVAAYHNLHEQVVG